MKIILLVLIGLYIVTAVSLTHKPNSIVENVVKTTQNLAWAGCTTTMDALTGVFLHPIGVKVLEYSTWWICRLTVFNDEQCTIAVESYIDVIVSQIKLKTFESAYFWEVTLGIWSPDKYTVLGIEDEAKRILADKPGFIRDNKYLDKLYDEIAADRDAGRYRETMRVYHVTDLHLNFDYTPGTSNNCGKIACCNSKSGIPLKEEEKAGKWGDYHCDTNPVLLDKLKEAIDRSGKPDMFVWTGDNDEHAISTDVNVTTYASVYATKFFRKNFPNTVMFPIHGNHELNPMSVQDMRLDRHPVFETLSEAWSPWFNGEVKSEFVKNTYYSYLAGNHPQSNGDFRRKMDKTRIIAWNLENWYAFNFYLIGEHNDPKQEFAWLESTLKRMEQNGEVAIMIGHISPGMPDCVNSVSARIRLLQDRYQHIIRLSLYGHTHHEEMEVVRAYDDNKPVGVNFVTSSFTSYSGNNPSFRVVTLDVKTKLPIKIETYTLDLEKANKDDSYAKFVLTHELSKEYNMKDLRPSEILKLSDRLYSDENLAVKYLMNTHANGSRAKIYEQGCDESCRRIVACKSAFSVYLDSVGWLKLPDIDIKRAGSVLIEFFHGVWVKKN